MGTVISSIISSLGEMTALMPVNGPIMEFPRRFLDRGVGLAVGWIYWFAYCVLAADQLVAFSNSVKFQYNDNRTYLNWKVGMETDPAVWVPLALVLVVLFNMLPVRVSPTLSLNLLDLANNFHADLWRTRIYFRMH
jgi:yeast amino acid transporter